ncbi:hypothetical protein [Micromonospora coxensis]|uniref:hypothetical protein n=1 Tax=Micromonospora coxensis TaxID=356852 RepID=UPI00342914F6
MSPTVSRLLRWATVIGVGIAVTLAVWQDPVVAYAGVAATAAGPVPGAVALVALVLTATLVPGLARAAGPGLPTRLSWLPDLATHALRRGLALAARRPRPVSVARPPGAPRRISASRPPTRRRSRR